VAEPFDRHYRRSAGRRAKYFTLDDVEFVAESVNLRGRYQ
jgi:hypothetical protein